MQKVTLQQFETAVTSHPNDDVLDVVFFTSPGCVHCGPFLERMEGISVNKANFFVVELEDLPPLFAVPGIPSMTVFQRGGKIMECLCSETVSRGTVESLLINIEEGSIPGPSML